MSDDNLLVIVVLMMVMSIYEECRRIWSDRVCTEYALRQVTEELKEGISGNSNG